MSHALADVIRSDFLEWSGGFPPESTYEVYVYVELARPRHMNEDDVREFLLGWMNEGAPRHNDCASTA
jgi:hypothetical protein